MFQGYFRVFQGCLKCILLVNQSCFKGFIGTSMCVQRCYKAICPIYFMVVSLLLQGCLLGVSKIQGCFIIVLGVIKGLLREF